MAVGGHSPVLMRNERALLSVRRAAVRVEVRLVGVR